MTTKKVLVFTGGGSGGHVMPALTVINKVNHTSLYDVHYVGGIASIERDLVKDYKLTYHPIQTGKLRRSLTLKSILENIKDIFRIFQGLIDSFKELSQFNKQDTLVISFGGFVSVPVVIAAKLQGKKIYIHEQTSRVGLANRICSRFASKVFISFEESFNFFDRSKTFYSGYPLRENCYSETINSIIINGRTINQSTKPVLFVTGGGNGAQLLNKLIERNFSLLTERFLVIHQVGKAHIKEFKKLVHPDYIPLAFIGPEMIDLMKLATVTVSRSGAGTVCELIAIGKKSIFIPLSIAQKNEQYHNALEAHKKLGSIIILEKNLSDDVFLKAIYDIGKNNLMKKIKAQNGLDYLVNEINSAF